MKSALIVVDYQNDFVEGGNFPINGGKSILPKINELVDQFELVIYTKDWHPANHKSFASNHEGKKIFDIIELNGEDQKLWPNHCIQGTPGSDFVPGLKMHRKMYIFKKGLDSEIDNYSAFYDNQRKNSTELADFLRMLGIETVFICGLATDYCVKNTALDAKREKFEAVIIEDACAAMDPNFNIYDLCYEYEIGVLKTEDVNLIK